MRKIFKLIISISLLLLLLLLLFVMVVMWGFFVEPNSIKTEQVTIKVDEEFGFLTSQKMLQISDLHMKDFGQKEGEVLEKIKKESPDFVFITGDIVDWSTKDFSGLEKFLAGLSENFSNRIFAVWGNHDHRNNQFEELKNILEEGGVQVLSNESEKLEIGFAYLYLIGVDDPHLGYDDFDEAATGTEEGAFKILLAHSPEVFRKIIDKKVNLVLVGHTHGCQVNLPFICDLFLPLEYDKKYKSGLFKENSTYLYVNRGIGETIMPFRLNAPPEITIFNFQKND